MLLEGLISTCSKWRAVSFDCMFVCIVSFAEKSQPLFLDLEKINLFNLTGSHITIYRIGYESNKAETDFKEFATLVCTNIKMFL